MCKTCDPMAGPILTQAKFNKLRRGLLDGKYPGFLHIKVLINTNVKLELLGPGHFSNKAKISINLVEVYWQMPYIPNKKTLYPEISERKRFVYVVTV